MGIGLLPGDAPGQAGLRLFLYQIRIDNRFSDSIIATCVERLFFISNHGLRGQGNNGDLTSWTLQLSDLTSRFPAIENR
jgi:hypothetical protein